MKRIRIARPSPALVIASLALFISLGGVGYSQLNLPNKSIDSHHLARDLIKGRHLANDAVDSQHLARAAVDSHHLAADSVKKQEIASKAVTRGALQKNAIISRLVQNGSLSRKDFAPSAVPPRHYAGILIPNAATRTLGVGRETESFDAASTTYNGRGDYTITFDLGRDSIGCAMPHALPIHAPPEVTLRITRLECSAEQNVIGIATSTGEDAQVVLKVTFTS
jgi:hypothetical protein